MNVMKWARFDGNRVIETTDIDPAGRFHGSITWEPVPADVTANSTREGGAWSIVRIDQSEDETLAFLRQSVAGLSDDPDAQSRLDAYKIELENFELAIQARNKARIQALIEALNGA